MADEGRPQLEAFSFFSTQMLIHMVRGLVSLGVSPDWIKSNIRKTLAEGIEQFSPAHRPHLEGLARTFDVAVDEGLRQRSS